MTCTATSIECILEEFIGKKFSGDIKRMVVKFLPSKASNHPSAIIISDTRDFLLYRYAQEGMPKCLETLLKNNAIAKVIDEECDDNFESIKVFYKLAISSHLHLQKFLDLVGAKYAMDDVILLSLAESDAVSAMRKVAKGDFKSRVYEGEQWDELHLCWFKVVTSAFCNLFCKANSNLWNFGSQVDEQYYLSKIKS